MNKACKDHRSFVTRFGNFSSEVIPFGLINAPAAVQKMMEELLKDLSFERPYLYDELIHSDTIEVHVNHLQVLFRLFQKSELKLRGEKCAFGTDIVERLGHIFSTEGVKIDPEKIESVRHPLFLTIILLPVASPVSLDTIFDKSET